MRNKMINGRKEEITTVQWEEKGRMEHNVSNYRVKKG
jgi:hypothetical protein